jgi:uncharacterized protein (DUF1800 family)
MARADQRIQHLLRRAGFGTSQDEAALYGGIPYAAAVDALVNYEQMPDDADARIGEPGHVGITTRGQFSPNTNITDARQRWLFRMVHSQRPLQEKMALFWHNHFATAYSKISGAVGGANATRMLAAKPTEDAGGAKGQLELLREYALGNFRELLVAIARDPAMLVWLDGRTNFRARPQENFARELMELFTFGVGHFTEPDVYAGARVFTGWNLQIVNRDAPDQRYEFIYNPNQHDTGAKEFSFPIYAGGGRIIPARTAAEGLQDGVDLINAVARHPETGPRLARKLYRFFVSETSDPPPGFVSRLANVYYQSGYDMRIVVRAVLTSPEFNDPDAYFSRYSWPVEYVVRAIKEVGWSGFSVNDALTPLVNMGQQLFEPPDVNGWELGQGWFSTGGMLARMNFAAAIANNQRFALRDAARAAGQSPQALLSYVLDRLTPADLDRAVYDALLTYLRMGGTWTGSDAQLLAKTAGLVHIVVGTGEYQLV